MKCNTDTTAFAFRGACAYRFQGRTSEDARLNQLPTLTGLSFTLGDTLAAAVQYRTNDVAPRLRLRVKVFYADTALGVGKSHNTITQTAPDYTLFTAVPLTLLDGEIEKIKFQFWNLATTGKIDIDEASLIWTGAGVPR